jgi:hypothetical protein
MMKFIKNMTLMSYTLYFIKMIRGKRVDML